jgi:hypothetical protein
MELAFLAFGLDKEPLELPFGFGRHLVAVDELAEFLMNLFC